MGAGALGRLGRGFQDGGWQRPGFPDLSGHQGIDQSNDTTPTPMGTYKAWMPSVPIGQPPDSPSSPTPLGTMTSCFIDGVQVELADGSEKNVSDINVGDEVKTDKGSGVVKEVYPSKAGGQKLYGFNGKEPFATEMHPFMTQDGWKKISEVTDGDTLYRNGKGEVTVESVTSIEIPEDTPVYNFHVDGHETYFADGYLVHNKFAPDPSIGPRFIPWGEEVPGGFEEDGLGGMIFKYPPGRPISDIYPPVNSPTAFSPPVQLDPVRPPLGGPAPYDPYEGSPGGWEHNYQTPEAPAADPFQKGWGRQAYRGMRKDFGNVMRRWGTLDKGQRQGFKQGYRSYHKQGLLGDPGGSGWSY